MLYDLYEKQKMTEAKMAIYKAVTDEDEMSKSLCMKKYLGWTDEEVQENFNGLIEDKQRVAIADYFGELISKDNPPVDIKSPIKLKSDVDDYEKSIGAKNAPAATAASEGGESANDGTDEGEENAEAESSAEAEEPETKEAEIPTFGLA